MRTRNGLWRFSRLLAALLTLSLVAAACGSDDEGETSSPTTTAAPDSGSDDTAAPDGIQTDGFESLGDVTLDVLAEAGDEAIHLSVGPALEDQHFGSMVKMIRVMVLFTVERILMHLLLQAARVRFLPTLLEP